MDSPTPATSPSPASSSSSTDIRAFLRRVRSRLRRHDGLRVLYWMLAALLGLGIAVPLIAQLVVGTRQGAFALLAGAGLIASLVAIAALVLGAIVPARRWRSDAAVARHVGRRAPPV
ncbi:MAG: hypothetical protein KC464_07960, partial [Myxococcales bacterium]|nr:hypothetical protein [Myxococcales bacterium]